MAEEKSQEKPVQGEVVNKNDVDENKVYAILAYFGLLVLIPILVAKDSKFAQFHANQGLILLIVGVILSVVTAFPVLGWLLGIVAWPAYLVLSIIGIINAAQGEMKQVPLVGGYTILK